MNTVLNTYKCIRQLRVYKFSTTLLFYFFLATLAGALDGSFLPIQLVYQGKTSQCHPKFKFHRTFHITESENHWANQGTMFDFIDKVIKPYVNEIIDRNDLPLHQKAIVTFDCFRAQITEDFLAKLTQDRLFT